MSLRFLLGVGATARGNGEDGNVGFGRGAGGGIGGEPHCAPDVEVVKVDSELAPDLLGIEHDLLALFDGEEGRVAAIGLQGSSGLGGARVDVEGEEALDGRARALDVVVEPVCEGETVSRRRAGSV